MAHRVSWSRRALRDVESIAEFIADSPTYARTVVKKIIHQTRMLSQFPKAGRKVPEFDDENVRELVVYSYRIIYRLQEDVLIASGNSWQAEPAVTNPVHFTFRRNSARLHLLVAPT